jgi:hypothetical protein
MSGRRVGATFLLLAASLPPNTWRRRPEEAMELLIPGLILVGLMIYVSTRIKRSAAGAYEKETVETEEFSVTKPEGFIIIEGHEPGVIFAAYSKEYGTGDADEIRRVTAKLRVWKDRSAAQVREAIIKGSELVDERHLSDGTLILETRVETNGVPLDNEYRIAERNETTYEFSVSTISETKADDQKDIDELLTSFELK